MRSIRVVQFEAHEEEGMDKALQDEKFKSPRIGLRSSAQPSMAMQARLCHTLSADSSNGSATARSASHSSLMALEAAAFSLATASSPTTTTFLASAS